MKNFGRHISNDNASDRDHPARSLIRAAEAAGRIPQEEYLFRDDAIAEERLGMVIGIIRRHKKITQEELALKAGCDLEILIALEMGILDTQTIYRVLPGIMDGLGMDSAILNQILKTE